MQQEHDEHKQEQIQWRTMEQKLSMNSNMYREMAGEWEGRARYWEDRAKAAEAEVLRRLEQIKILEDRVRNLETPPKQHHETPQEPDPRMSISALTDLPPPPSCDSCGENGRCACADEVFATMSEVKEEQPDSMEIDMTNFGKKCAPKVHHVHEPIDIDQETNDAIMKDGCGFCSKPGGEACPCKDLGVDDTPLVDEPISTKEPPPRSEPLTTQTQSMLASQPPTSGAPRIGPGSCIDCQNDPERRAFCMAMGGLVAPTNANVVTSDNEIDFTNYNPTPRLNTTAGKDPGTGINGPPPDKDLLAQVGLQSIVNGRISCADTYSAFKRLPPESRNRTAFLLNVHARPIQHSNIPQQGVQNSADSTLAGGGTSSKLHHNNNGEDARSHMPLEVEAASMLVALGTSARVNKRIPPRQESVDFETGSD